ncbi:MAG: hypothetical protein HN855_02035 [Anaerolineae bacterium]|jgi:hypothetical protein|nr:hypothetical protein [Anaerolineae bacterium]MBT7073107.1 hypothetical protein [Anaerolineae bacterium]MBT7323918.1 hypothetical protein [Anaerolineae bacterium]
MENRRKLELVSGFLIAVTALLYIALLYVTLRPSLTGEIEPRPHLSQSVKVEDLEVCGINYSDDGSPATVDICGVTIIEDDANTAYLGILVFWMPEKILVSRGMLPDDLFEEGPFSREVDILGKETTLLRYGRAEL